MTKDELDELYVELDDAIKNADHGKAADCSTAILHHCIISQKPFDEEIIKRIKILLSKNHESNQIH